MNFIAKFAAVDDENLATGIGGGIGRACQSIEQRHFAESLPGADQI